MKNQHTNNLLLLTLATVFTSTSGALGKVIDLPTPVIIWWRCLLVGLFLLAFGLYKRYNLKIQSRKDFLAILLSAFLMGAHWIAYFYALKLSNVAIGMLSLFAYPIFYCLVRTFFYEG